MSKRPSDMGSTRPPKRRQIDTADEDTEEGEVSDDSSPNKDENSLHSFSKVALPFKTKAKPEPGPSTYPPPPRGASPHGPSNSRGRQSSPPMLERRRHDEHPLYPREHRRSRSRSREYARREWPERHPQHWPPPYEDDRRHVGRDTYIPPDVSPPHRRRRSRSRSISRSPHSRNPHRLPRRRSPSPPHRRREDHFYRPRSPYAADYYRPVSPPYGGVDTYAPGRDAMARDHGAPRGHSPPRFAPISLPPKPSHEILSHPNASSSSNQPTSVPNDPPQSHSLVRDGKIQLNNKHHNRTSIAVDPNVALLDPDSDAVPRPTQHSAPSQPPAAAVFSPLESEKPPPPPQRNYDDEEGEERERLPPQDVPPPIPSLTTSKAHSSRSSTHRPPAPLPRVPLNGTSTMRSSEDDMTAYGRNFIGVDKLSDFEMLNKLGEGTFGEVHKARRKGTGQLVALKRILMRNETEGVPITALREIKILKKLNHPSIVTVVSMVVQRQQQNKTEASIYMVFPYMDHDLSGLLENVNVSLTISQIKLYMKQLCEGVAYLHRNKILHRDLKSANLLINNEGCLQVADFGLARPVSFIGKRSGIDEIKDEARRNYTNSVVTRWYRSPELLLGQRKYEGWVDMWGVGCIFAEMFHRKPILPGSSDADQLTLIFQLCGHPTEDNFPGWNRFDPKNEVRATWAPSVRRIRSILPESCSQDTVDFLDRLLTLDPKRRITAYECLDHAYFWTEPLPADPKTLAKYESSHEFNRRRLQPVHAPHHAPLPVSHMPQNGQFYGQSGQFYNNNPTRGLPRQSAGGWNNAHIQPPPQHWQARGPPGPPMMNGGHPGMNHRGPPPPGMGYGGPPPPVVLPPIHIAPGRPPPGIPPVGVPVSSGNQNGRSWEPPPRDPYRANRPEWDRGPDDGRREGRRPPPRDELNYG